MCGFPESYVFSYSLSLKRLFILLLQGNLNDPKFNSLDGLDREILFLIHFPDREKPLNKGEKKKKKKKTVSVRCILLAKSRSAFESKDLNLNTRVP